VGQEVRRVDVARVGVDVDAGRARVRRAVVEDDDLVYGEDCQGACDAAGVGGALFAGCAAGRLC
jgi:hypothetical protein